MLLVFVPKCYFTFCKNNFEYNLKFYSGLYKIDLLSYGSTICDYFHILWNKILVTAPEIRCVALTPSSSASARGTGDHTWVNKLQQFFYTLSVSQDFNLFLDLTYSLNVLSITCILCKTVTSASRTLKIT